MVSSRHFPGSAVRIDTDRPAHAEQRLTAEYVSARALAESATLAEAAVRVLQALCEALGWDYGALWNVDADGGVLHCVETWHLPTVDVSAIRSGQPAHDLHARRRTAGTGVGQRRARVGS